MVGLGIERDENQRLISPAAGEGRGNHAGWGSRFRACAP